jgi:hypothetical protein
MQRVMLLLLVACATEPAPPSNPESLFGTWRYLPADPTRTPVEERQLVTFAEDGTYTIEDPSDVQTGRYQLAGHDLTITMADGFITTGVAATDDRMVIDALFPQGDIEIAGTWIGTQSAPDVTSTITLELDADGTAHLGQSGTLSGEDDATWLHADPFMVLTFANPTRTRAMPVLPGVALGEWLYERM